MKSKHGQNAIKKKTPAEAGVLRSEVNQKDLLQQRQHALWNLVSF